MGEIIALVTSIAQISEQRKARQQADKRAKELANKPLPAPVGVPEIGETETKLGTKRRRSRASTILTGDLIPTDIGKKTLLG